MTTAPPALPGRPCNKCLKESHEFTRPVPWKGGHESGWHLRMAPAYPLYRRRPVSTAQMDPDLRRDDKHGVKGLVPATSSADQHLTTLVGGPASARRCPGQHRPITHR